MRELALHLLDIAENSVAAGASNIEISVRESTILDKLSISVNDNGKGMSKEMVEKVVDPFVTSRTTRKVGLGIPLLKAATETCNGQFSINSIINSGTKVCATFQRSHIDRMPLGDLANTFLNLLVSYPHIIWKFHYAVDENNFTFDNIEIMKELEGIPLTDATVLKYLREIFEVGVNSLKPID